MARTNNLTNYLTDVAAAIKAKKGYESTDTISAADFDTEILNINTVNNQHLSVTENGTYTPDTGFTGFDQVIVDVDSIPEGIFIQEETPTKTTSEALWLKEADVGSETPLLDRIPVDTILYLQDGTSTTTYQAVLNSLTQEQKDLFNSKQYLLLGYNAIADGPRGYRLCGFDDYRFVVRNNKLYLNLNFTSSDKVIMKSDYGVDISSGTGHYDGPDVDYMLTYGYWSSADLVYDNEVIIHQTGVEQENGVYVTVDGTRYIVYKSPLNGSWTKILDTSNADATAGDILTGKTAFVNNTKLTGTMPNNGAINITPSATQQAIPAGYTSGGTVAGDANLVQANIKAGVSIFGVQGNLEPDKPDQTKTATPTTSEQVIEPDTGYELASVTVEAVDNTIDENIVATNIRAGITILGVIGSLQEGEMSHEDYVTALELAENILGSGEYEDTMDVFNDIDGGSDTYTGLGGTEDEIEEVLDEIIGEEETE